MKHPDYLRTVKEENKGKYLKELKSKIIFK